METEHSYKPQYLTGTEIFFVIINQGEPSTRDYPGCRPEVELIRIEKFGVDVGGLVFDNQIELSGDDYEKEIIQTLEIRNGKINK